MRFRTLIVRMGHSHVWQISPDLEAAFEHVACEMSSQATPGSERFRMTLRKMGYYAEPMLRLWAELPDGRWLSLDPEDAQDALQSTQAYQSYIESIPRTAPAPGPLTYRLRLTSPLGVPRTTYHPRITDVFRTISRVRNFPAPLARGFTHWLWRSPTEPTDLSLSARFPLSPAAVPLPLPMADTALASQHAELRLQERILGDFVMSS